MIIGPHQGRKSDRNHLVHALNRFGSAFRQRLDDDNARDQNRQDGCGDDEPPGAHRVETGYAHRELAAIAGSKTNIVADSPQTQTRAAIRANEHGGIAKQVLGCALRVADCMFRLAQEEADSLRFQFGTLKRGHHSKNCPIAFAEQVSRCFSLRPHVQILSLHKRNSHMQPKPISHAMQQPAHRHFRRRILPPNPAHVPASAFFAQQVFGFALHGRDHYPSNVGRQQAGDSWR